MEESLQGNKYDASMSTNQKLKETVQALKSDSEIQHTDLIEAAKSIDSKEDAILYVKTLAENCQAQYDEIRPVYEDRVRKGYITPEQAKEQSSNFTGMAVAFSNLGFYMREAGDQELMARWREWIPEEEQKRMIEEAKDAMPAYDNAESK